MKSLMSSRSSTAVSMHNSKLAHDCLDWCLSERINTCMTTEPCKYSIFYIEDGKLAECFTDTAWTLFGKLALLNARGMYLGCVKPAVYADRFYSDFDLFCSWLHVYHESPTHIIAIWFDNDAAFWMSELPLSIFKLNMKKV